MSSFVKKIERMMISDCLKRTMNLIFKTSLLLFCTLVTLFSQESTLPKPIILNTEEVTVTFKIRNEWDTGYEATIFIHNKKDYPLQGWKASFDAEDQNIDEIWNARITAHDGSHYDIGAVQGPWNREIPPLGDFSFGYIARGKRVTFPHNISFSLEGEDQKTNIDNSHEVSPLQPLPTTGDPTTDLDSKNNSASSNQPSTPPENSSSPSIASDSQVPQAYENSVWVEDWTDNLDQVDFIKNLPRGVNTINIFVGELVLVHGVPTITGFCSDTPGKPSGTGATPNIAALTHFIQECKKQGVIVKLSLGGQEGTSFGNSWQCLTELNIPLFAQALVEFCKTTGADGVDFDEEIENENTFAALSGKLAGTLRDLAPELQTSYCVYGGCSATGPWHQTNKTFLENARTHDGKCALDRIYVMSYYDGSSLEENLQYMECWEKWLKQYDLNSSHLSAGIDPNDHQTLPEKSDFKAWIEAAKTHGWSTAIWDQLGVQDYVNHDWGTVIHDCYMQ